MYILADIKEIVENKNRVEGLHCKLMNFFPWLSSSCRTCCKWPAAAAVPPGTPPTSRKYLKGPPRYPSYK